MRLDRPSASQGKPDKSLFQRLARKLYDIDKDKRLLVSIAVIAALALETSLITIREAETYLVKTEATGAATHWAKLLQTKLEGLDDILAAGLVSEHDRETLDFASEAGRIYSYQVIRPDGVIAMSSWSGDFRDAIDPQTIMLVAHEGRIITDVKIEETATERFVLGQAYVPLRSSSGREGALKVAVNMTREAARYRSIGNSAFITLLGLLLVPGSLCGWLISINIRARQRNERLQAQRSEVFEELAKNAPLHSILERIAGFIGDHHQDALCTIVVLNKNGYGIEHVISSEGDIDPSYGHGDVAALPATLTAALSSGSPLVQDDRPMGYMWSTPLRAASGAILGSFNVTFPKQSTARAAGIGPSASLADLTALAIEYQRAEAMLADIQQRHELILTSAGDGIFGIDAKGHISFANPAAARMLGRRPSEMVGQDARALIYAPGANRPVCPLTETLADGISQHIPQIRLRRRDGSEFAADLMVTPVSRHASDLRAVVVFHDISAQIQVQQQLRSAKEEAEMASNAKSNFLANMSHELRTPLNAIIGFSEVMLQQVLGPLSNPRYQKYAEDIHLSGRHLLTLINDLLDLSKIEAGKLELTEETVHLPALLEDCQVFIGDTIEINKLSLTIDIMAGLQFVRGDEQKLRQVLINLLSNAAKFTEPGGRIALLARRDHNDTLHIEITDTGVGIAPDKMARVMSRFGQADEVFSRKKTGTGLGLPLAKALVELHGGTLVLQSIPNQGTTAIVRLPGRAPVNLSPHNAKSPHALSA